MNSTNPTNNGNLSRDDIRTYRTSKDERIRNAIERKSMEDDFDADALEGWSDSALSETSMRRLDKKFAGKNYFSFLVTATVIIGAGIIGAILLNDSTAEQTTVTTAQQQSVRVVDKTDLVLPEKIEEMVELPVSQQISPNTVIREFDEQKEVQQQLPSAPEQTVNELPIHVIEDPAHPEKLLRETVMGKEIYLSDLKVLDYRAYRSKPSIQTKQLELTGTPADQSEPGQQKEDEFTWKTVDIPYIEYLEKTMDIFGRGNNKKALARFEEILKTYPDDVNALFYAGLCYYNLNEFDKAASAFEKCVDSRYINFNEEAYWYLAKSLLAANETGRAKQILTEIRDAGGYYSKQAEKLLK